MKALRYIYLPVLASLLLTTTSFAQNDDFRKQAPAPGPAPKIQLGDFTDFKLDNGLHVIVVENHKLPRVSFRLFVDVPVYPDAALAGRADMAGQLLRTGTTKRTKAEIDEQIDFIGANLSTNAYGAFASGITRYQEELLTIMSEVIQQPSFPEAEFEKLKTQTLSALAQAKEDPEAIADNVSRALRFKDHPYSEITTEATVNAITPAACREYYEAFFRPDISYLVMVGDITPAKARELATTYFGSWQAKDVKRLPLPEAMFPEQPTSTEVAFVPKTGAVQSTINITYPVSLRPGSPDVIPARLLNAILGSGFNGRLFNNLREDKGYTYGAYSRIDSDRSAGYFNAYANVRNEVTDSAVTQFLYELERIRTEMVTEEELQRAKNMVTGSFARSLESPEAIARFALNTVRYKLPRDYYPTYLQRLAEVSRADLLEIAQEYIRPDAAHLVVVGNKDTAEKLTRFDDSGEITRYNVYGVEQQLASPHGLMMAGVSPANILDRYVEAIGGREVVDALTDMTVEMEGSVQGMAMKMVQRQKAPDKFLMSVEMSGMQVNKTVVNGEDVSVLEMGNPKPLEEADKPRLREQAVMIPEARYAELGYELKLDGSEQVGNEQAYVLEVTKPDGSQVVEYYGVDSGLKLRAVAIEGETTITTDYLDYEEQEGGLWYPTTMRISGMAPIPLEFKVTQIAVNSGLEDEAFK
jgi:predicted Zn-dependent peptidase